MKNNVFIKLTAVFGTLALLLMYNNCSGVTVGNPAKDELSNVNSEIGNEIGLRSVDFTAATGETIKAVSLCIKKIELLNVNGSVLRVSRVDEEVLLNESSFNLVSENNTHLYEVMHVARFYLGADCDGRSATLLNSQDAQYSLSSESSFYIPIIKSTDLSSLRTYEFDFQPLVDKFHSVSSDFDLQNAIDQQDYSSASSYNASSRLENP